MGRFSRHGLIKWLKTGLRNSPRTSPVLIEKTGFAPAQGTVGGEHSEPPLLFETKGLAFICESFFSAQNQPLYTDLYTRFKHGTSSGPAIFCASVFRHLSGYLSGPVPLSDVDFKPKEFRIIACGLSGYSDLWFNASFRNIKDGVWFYAFDSVVRRMGFMCGMHPVLIIPDLILVESSLYSIG